MCFMGKQLRTKGNWTVHYKQQGQHGDQNRLAPLFIRLERRSGGATLGLRSSWVAPLSCWAFLFSA